jgi:large subunit ribosomal protein L5
MKGYAIMARLEILYKEKITPALINEFHYKNRMQVPRLMKIVVSMGVGKAIQEKKRLDSAVADLTSITGQKPLVCPARKSVSNFKLREGMPIGAKVTLRGARMYEFLDRLISLSIPRIRDFRGLNPDGFDGRGNYSLGVAEQSVFPEINAAKVEYQQGLNVSLVTSAKTDAEAKQLLNLFGMPFRS